MPVKIQSVIAKGALVGLLAVVAMVAVLLVLLLAALLALVVAAGGKFPVGGDPVTFFTGGGWIDLLIILLLAFASGFLLTVFRHSSESISVRKWLRPHGTHS